jgi:hypothetical protein
MRPWSYLSAGLFALMLNLAGIDIAEASIGEIYLQVPGVSGGWNGARHRGWIRVEARMWGRNTTSVKFGPSYYSGPDAPRRGREALVIAVNKHSPALAALMNLCHGRTAIAAMRYAESAEQLRPPGTLGVLDHKVVPEYLEFKFTDAQLTECPLVSDAPEQAFVVSFKNIQWLNYRADEKREPYSLKPTQITPMMTSGKTRTFVITWFGLADNGSKDKCPVMNAMPTDDAYYDLLSKQQADLKRAEFAKNGGVPLGEYEVEMDRRGPGQLSACLLPGLVRDPGHAEPQTRTARGFNLDGNDGSGSPPPGTCKHRNYVSEDGQVGIDNQLYTVDACIPGYGRNGVWQLASNELRRNGLVSILVTISGIKDDKNDDSVEVTILYSLDKMAKDVTGKQVLPDYTFQATDKPEYRHLFTRLHGRIINGVLITDPVEKLAFNLGLGVLPELRDARMRLQFMPDGSIKGLVGGYHDWRAVMNTRNWVHLEQLFGFQCPGVYNALKRAADGLKDPVTGECNGISAAYDIEGVPAYLTPEELHSLIVRAPTSKEH